MKKSFENIKLSHLRTLCSTIAESKVRHLSYIKEKYAENGYWFDETLTLLEDLKIVRNISDELFLSKAFSNLNDSLEDFKFIFLTNLLSINGELNEELKKFLVNFQFDKETPFFKTSELDKIKFSGIRNLLLELGFISVNDDKTTYFLNSDYGELFIKQIIQRKFTPESLKKKQEENESLGLEAEKVVIEFELNRLKNISIKPNEIKHTSQENVLAGYDIKSFENYLDINSKRINRYIEVKAVSIKDYKFYWSRIEMEIAKVLGKKYYLYLLPSISNNTFDVERIMIVNNPYKDIFLNESDWIRGVESLSFEKNIVT